jgi:hypothetical protein
MGNLAKVARGCWNGGMTSERRAGKPHLGSGEGEDESAQDVPVKTISEIIGHSDIILEIPR